MKIIIVIALSLLVSSILVPTGLLCQELAQPAPNIQMTNNTIVELLRLHARPEEVVALIQRNDTAFDLTPENLATLQSAGANAVILDAMWKSTLKSAQEKHPATQAPTGRTPAQTGRQQETPAVPSLNSSQPSAGNGNAAAAPPKMGTSPPNEAPIANKVGTITIPIQPDSSPSQPNSSSKKPPYPPHTPERFHQAIATSTVPQQPPKPDKISCAATGKHTDVSIDWADGGQSTTYLRNHGSYCFELNQINNILYAYSSTLKEQSDSAGNPFDLLKGAISAISDFGTGSKAAGGPSPNPKACAVSIDDVTSKSQTLKEALAALDPSRDSNGKFASIPLSKTETDWAPVPPAFDAFQQAVGELIAQMVTNSTAAGCQDIFAAAEYVILNQYVPAQKNYEDLLFRISLQHLKYFQAGIDNSMGYDLIVTESYQGQQTAAGSKTFHFDAAYSLLNSSAGFMLTELSSRVYSSRTAPNPSNPSTTQSVLGVDYGAGITPGLVALLNTNPPYVNWRNFGLGISAGPTFVIANGKANTSIFGFFGGLSIRLTPYLYLTPGVQVGQFADFPQGFTHSGQVIPPNTGTPVPNNRYSARFAFAVTFKIKGIGTSSQTNVSSTAGDSQTKNGPANPNKPGSATQDKTKPANN